jgi:hypothetical protein
MRRPRGGGVVGDRHVYDGATFVGEDDEHEQEPASRGLDDKEIGGGDLVERFDLSAVHPYL